MAPHFGRMDAERMSPEEAHLMRAKLHWSSGLKRLRGSNVSDGIAVFYDALLSGMRWYVMVHLRHEVEGEVKKRLEDEQYLFSLLRRHGIIDQTCDPDHLLAAVDRVLRSQEPGADPERIIRCLTELFTRLGVLPFNEAELPPEPGVS